MNDKKMKVVNPFSLIGNFLSKKSDADKESGENTDAKKKRVKRGTFNLDEELTDELAFMFIQSKNNFNSYRYIPIPELYLFWQTETDEISIYYAKKLVGKINFIPNSRLFLEMFVKKTIEKL